MARHDGKNGKVKLGANFIGHVTQFSVTEKAAVTDLTSADDTWEAKTSGKKSWDGSLTFRLDWDVASNQEGVRAGDELALELYTEGDASGKKYLTGTVIVSDRGVSTGYADPTELTFSFTGNGALTISAVI